MPASSGAWQIPRPLQRLFDTFPLLTYDRPADLPERARAAVSDDLPTLYIFTSPEDAALGAPSFNPGCLKWQTYLRLHSLPHRTLPSTNHASPTGSLPFLLPPSSSSSSTSTPIPASQFPAYITRRQTQTSTSTTTTTPQTKPHPPPPATATPHTPTPASTAREELIQSLLPPLRTAFLLTLYLTPTSLPLLTSLYLTPSTSSPLLQSSLLSSLRRAAEQEVLKTLAPPCSATAVVGGRPIIDVARVRAEARAAMEALAGFLADAGTEGGEGEGDGDGPWFSTGGAPGEVDCGVFGFLFLMRRFFSSSSSGDGEKGGEGLEEGLGDMVKAAGRGELEGHVRRMAGRVGWGGYL
ncbi:hypothetical protein QBC39DRAFT_415005 [Podospora conica]|nr:hypothetical protein QBC39DRAFT_415005 [Schizothecium conicum]